MPDYGERGVYKFNREVRIASFVITRQIAERLGKDAFDAETADGPVHFEWTRKEDGAVAYSYSAPTNWEVFVRAYGAPPRKNPKPEANFHFWTRFPPRGVLALEIARHREDWAAGPYADNPFPTNEIKAANNFCFGIREALARLGFDRPDAMEGKIWIGTFDTSFPNGHTDFPPHFHIIPHCRDGQQTHHFYVRREDGRIASDCFQDMGRVIDVWDRAVEFRLGEEFPCYDGKGRVAFRVRMLADGTGLDLLTPDRTRCARVASDRPCVSMSVLVREDDGWRAVKTFAVTDDLKRGEMDAPEGLVRYDPATGKRLADGGK